MKKLTPRDYQLMCANLIIDDLIKYNSTIAVMATGLGKTILACLIVQMWNGGNILFLAHTKELIYQAADKLAEALGYRPGVEMAENYVERDTIYQGEMVVVGSVQTMYSDKRLAKYKNDPFSLIIIDECHHAPASSTYWKIVDYYRKANPNLKVLGITATPNRSDKAAMGLMFEKESFQMGTALAIDQGWLVPIIQEYVVSEAINYDGLATKRDEFGEADFRPGELAEAMNDEGALHAVAKPLVEKAEERKTVVFSADVRHAHELAAAINVYKPGSATSIDGKTDNAKRAQIIKDFSTGNLQYLVNCAVLIEGFDAPQCSCVAMARPTKSVSRYTQMLGRSLRPLPGIVDGPPDVFERQTSIFTSDKPNALVLDFVGNSSHKLASVFDVLGGNYDVEMRDLAVETAQQGQKPPAGLLEQSRAIVELERELASRKKLYANVGYNAYEVNPFDHDAAPALHEIKPMRGGSSDGQIGLLIKLGVQKETAMRYSKAQAGAVIEDVGAKRCTTGQAWKLKQNGIDPTQHNMKSAGEILNKLLGPREKR